MKHYRIAGLRVAMESFGRTVEQAVPYEIPVEGEPDIFVPSDPSDIQRLNPHLPVEECEYLSTGSLFYAELLKFQGMVLHSSCVVVDNKAYLFTADCGTGKSTHTRLWLKQFGDRAYILNDDKPALRLENGIWYAYGTPWSGKHAVNRNARVPVAGIAILERGVENEISLFSGLHAIPFLLTQVLRPPLAEYRILVLESLNELLTRIPIWKLKCNMNPDAAMVSYLAMSGKSKEN